MSDNTGPAKGKTLPMLQNDPPRKKTDLARSLAGAVVGAVWGGLVGFMIGAAFTPPREPERLQGEFHFLVVFFCAIVAVPIGFLVGGLMGGMARSRRNRFLTVVTAASPLVVCVVGRLFSSATGEDGAYPVTIIASGVAMAVGICCWMASD